MGFWDVIYSVGDGVKGITPNLSTVKRAGGATYHYTAPAVIKIDQVVRVDGIQKLPQYWPDDQTRAQIGLFTTTLAKNTARYVVYEGFKHIPGATVATKLISDTMRDVKRENHKDGMKAMKTLKSKVDELEEDSKNSTPQQGKLSQNEIMIAKVAKLEEKSRKSIPQPEKLSQNENLSFQNTVGGGAEKPKDVINAFMKTEFVRNQMFRELLVPKIARMETKTE